MARELEQELDATQAALVQLQAGIAGLRLIAACDSLAGDMARRGLAHLENPHVPPVRRRP